MIRRPVILLLSLCALSAVAETASIVPADQRIDDQAATLELAEALFGRATTQSEALTTLEHWLAAHPGDQDAIITLARYYLWSHQPAQSAALLTANPGTGDYAATRLDILIDAYLQLGRYPEAAKLSDERLAGMAQPGAAQLMAAGNARFYAGDAAGALPFFQRAVVLAPDDLSLRRSLGLALAYSGNRAEARDLLLDIARRNPDDADTANALVGLADNAAYAAQALEVVRQRAERHPDDPNPLMEWADLEVILGHAIQARDLYTRAAQLAQTHPAPDLALRRAHARVTWGDFYGAEETFRAQLKVRPDDVGLRADLLNVLVSMNRLDEAQAGAEEWLAEASDPTIPQSILTAIRRKQHKEEATDTGPVTHPPKFDAATAGFSPEQAPGMTQIAGQHAAQGDFAEAIRWLRAAHQADPNYYRAWLNLAEFLAIDQHYDEANREFAALAAVLPDSRQVLLRQARALSWGRHYDEALAAYTHLRQLNPADPLPLLEQARVAGWAKHREEAADLFARSWLQPVDGQLAAALRALPATGEISPSLENWKQWAQNQPPLTEDKLDPNAAEPFAATERLFDELKTSSATFSAAERTALQQIKFNLRSDFLVQRAFWLENHAKQLAWERRWPRAEETYNRLLAVAPGNQEALFDLTQVQAAQGLGNRERATLQRLLTLDRNNRLAATALFRRDRRSAPLAYAAISTYLERGRDELSSIRRWRGELGAEFTADDRFKFRAAFLRWRDKPDTDPIRFSARGLMLGAEGVLANWLTASAEYTLKDYYNRAPGAIDLGQVQVWVPFKDALRVGAGYEVREESANVFAVGDGTRSTHHWLGAEAALSRRWEIAGRIDAIDYSDGNSGTDLWIAPSYIWSDHPRTFKTTLTLEARNTDKLNVYHYTAGQLTDITHPYWTPDDFFGAALTFEWRRNLETDFFIGAQEHWYDVRATINLSNDDNRGISWAADYVREWNDRWLIRLGLQQTFSEQWDDFGLSLRLSHRF